MAGRHRAERRSARRRLRLHARLSLASELADRDDQARISLQRPFETWRQLFVAGLTG
jgi:hypothetical protein